jgi:CRISPR/Cas system-associated protein Csx1
MNFLKLKVETTIIILLLLVPVCLSCNAKLKIGNEIVNKIENFKKETGKLPENLTEIGIKETEEGPVYYEKESETKYLLWFGTTLGESVSYNSETKQWE